MKIKLLSIIAVLFFLTSCNFFTAQNYSVNGFIEGKDQGVAYLQDRIHGLWVNIDSAAIDNGTFIFKGKLDYPKMHYISIPDVDHRLMVFLENSEITISIDAVEPSAYKVSGSASHETFTEFNNLMAWHDTYTEEIQKNILEAEILNQPNQVEQYKLEYEEATQAKKWATEDFVARHNDKTVAVFIATRYLATWMDGTELTSLVNSFDPSLGKSSYLKALKERADKLMKVAVGETAPDFTLKGIDGQQVSLSDFRGQYVLVSFWASWCPYCRQENPHLLKLYEKYGGENFEILGVSLDRSHEAWLRGISEDGLLWPQISDLQGWQNEASSKYAVSSIPANVLIDPQGVIIERNVPHEDLGNTLNQLLNMPV